MIEKIADLPEGTIGFKMTGKITKDDYEKVVNPAIECGLIENNRLKMLCQMGPEFDGYTSGAAWDDTQLGLKHWKGFERLAIVSDVPWVKTLLRAMAFTLPCPVKIFELDEYLQARLWLSESLGTVHTNFNNNGLLTVKLIGQLEPSVYENFSKELDSYFASAEPVHLLLDLRDFNGWQGLAGVIEHLHLVIQHRHVPKKIAIVGNKKWQKLAERIFSKFISAEVQYFEETRADSAQTWIQPK
ncbi:SpoIIAA family protein [Desulfotalea psychrophila]|uniref:STAS/SEC14 domain-containing protein n=1 Tax=Desulfotalea psychrophila (strain LSv54 / DSM 12343) TaxID=177439 RepID=Q6AK92_DESPS|nr:STAS/SEC14 domain-containing protein [Desulfotalea psychrophila]CAG37234.1 conserved hypothetical protein [Desulfotalea psychrophila LSv54]